MRYPGPLREYDSSLSCDRRGRRPDGLLRLCSTDMKQLAMTRRKDHPNGVPSDAAPANAERKQRAGSRAVIRSAPGAAGEDTAFDVWLTRGLHQLFDDVAREPIPDELLRLIDGDRKK
jgi:hypothetical protein